MPESKEYRKIKKIYGEKFAKLCRTLFPQILEEEGKLLEILSKKFSNNCNHFLGEDIIENNLIEEFKEYIFEQYDKKDKEKIDESKTPYEILNEAGYDLYECKTEEDIQSFRKYYASNEVLCTIYNGRRLDRCYCFWAIKKDVENIKREEFEKPNKSDEYSLSILAIQFDKRTGRVEIISRYNHSVPNPNCTLGNDLNNLAPGLEQSFADLLKERELKINSENSESFEIPGYTVANDGKYYKYNYEINGIYYCPENIVIDGGEVRVISSPERGMLIDYFYIDMQNKTITTCNGIEDSFVQDLQDIEKIEITKSDREDEEKIIKIFKSKIEEPIIIGIDKNSRIVRYENVNLKQAGDKFLYFNESLTMLELPNLERAGDGFLFLSGNFTTLKLPNLEQVGDDFLYYDNESLTTLELPNLKQVGDGFLCYNGNLTTLKLPNLKQAGDAFLSLSGNFTTLKLPNLEQVGVGFLCYDESLTTLELPNLKQVGDNFLCYNESLTTLELPNLEQVGDNFLYNNGNLTTLELPNLEQVGDNFLYNNGNLTTLELPNLEQVGGNFLYNNGNLTTLELPNLEQVGGSYFRLKELEETQKQLQNTLKKAKELENQVDQQIQQKEKNGTKNKE